MPELPEVEVATRQLRRWAKGRKVVEAVAGKTRVIRGQTPRRFAELAGHKLRDVHRVGKQMLLEFDGDEGLLSHLGMTGKWIRRKQREAAPSHVRFTLALDDGHALDYRDPRLFGRLVRGKVEALKRLPAWRALGPDPLGGIDVERLGQLLGKTKRSIKEALMDQRVLAGLGNIHVAEALHRAKLHPERPANTLTAVEVQNLARAIDASLRFALSLEDGAEPITYVEEGGENRFLVYGHEGEPCDDCGTTIERIVQGGRSTFFCPHCQPRRPARAEAEHKPGKRGGG
jgi:formamidopyrimidine-DNA glycosylase